MHTSHLLKYLLTYFYESMNRQFWGLPKVSLTEFLAIFFVCEMNRIEVKWPDSTLFYLGTCLGKKIQAVMLKYTV